MKVLFLNIPFIEVRDGNLWTGPNSGSCWPHTVPGLYCYVPFPFFMANATSYLQAHGIDATMYDAWAYRHTDYESVKAKVADLAPTMLVLETGTPLIVQTLSVAEWAKRELGCKIVLTGSHPSAYADELLTNPYVDAVVCGEYDVPCLRLAQGDTRRKHWYEYAPDINFVNGNNWIPYRDAGCIGNYLDPSMVHTPIQLQVNDARGCPYRCTYCSWIHTMYRNYRARAAANVLDEICQVLAKHPIGSIFFDSETFGAGNHDRLKLLCDGLKELKLQWSMMSRIDVSTREEYRLFVDSGCVGMRFGVESFHQHLLDRVNKHQDAGKAWEMCRWLLSEFKGIHIRLLTMRSLPGETQSEADEDTRKFAELQSWGIAHGNQVDIQVADCVAMPGTTLWRQMQDAGEGGKMREFSEYQPSHGSALAQRLRVYGSATKA